MRYEVKHLSICLFDICTSFGMVSRSLTVFKLNVFFFWIIFLLLSFIEFFEYFGCQAFIRFVGFFFKSFFLSLKNNFIYLSILATLGLCYAGFSLVVLPRLLTAVTSLAVEHGLEGAGLQ